MTQPDLARLEGLLEQQAWAKDWPYNLTPPGRPAQELCCEAVRALPALLARVRELEKGIEDIRQHTDPDDPDSYRCDDREGCLDTVQAIAAALALNRSETDAG